MRLSLSSLCGLSTAPELTLRFSPPSPSPSPSRPRPHSHRQHLAAAQKHYSALPVHYTDSRWTSIDAFLLSRCTELQHALDMPRDRLLSTLALVRAGVTYGGRTWGLEALVEEGADVESQNEECARRLMRDVYELSATLTKGAFSLPRPLPLAPSHAEPD